MSRFHAYLRNAASLVQGYDGSLPLSVYLKQYFALHKKFGSSDRRQVGGLVHQLYRAGHLTNQMHLEEGLMMAELLCHTEPTTILQELKPQWISLAGLTIAEKLAGIGLQWNASIHTPWLHMVQPQMDPESYALSHFRQPDLFARVRPGRMKEVFTKLNHAGIAFSQEGETTLRMSNGTRLDNILAINRDVTIQDRSSQLCGAVIRKMVPEFSGILWDACAASGGKSIMLHDLYNGKPTMVVSDIRESILLNLKERFRMAGIEGFQSYQADLIKAPNGKLSSLKADMILVDAPCTGSGTWSRTPEQHYFFKPQQADAFASTQSAICLNALTLLKPGGIYIYITCSVFEKENQAICQKLQNDGNLHLLHSEIIDGTLQGADSMYIAIFRITVVR